LLPNEGVKGLHFGCVTLDTGHIPLRLGHRMPLLYLEPATRLNVPEDLEILEKVRDFFRPRR
jgi:hypothetical protein